MRRGFELPLAVLVREGVVADAAGLWVEHPQLGKPKAVASAFFDGAEWCPGTAP